MKDLGACMSAFSTSSVVNGEMMSLSYAALSSALIRSRPFGVESRMGSETCQGWIDRRFRNIAEAGVIRQDRKVLQ
jgi:hypothetical protein